MQETYAKSLAAVLVYEGCYSNHPKDPGGATMKGVTQRVYDAYRISAGRPKQSVKSITDSELEAIYRMNYWNAVKGDLLPTGVDFVVFDGSVNSGPKQAIKWLQRALAEMGLYKDRIDGVLGSISMTALKAVDDNDLLIAKIIDRREAFLRSLKTFSTFGKGWLRRIQNVEQAGQAWASGSVGPAIVPIPNAGAKAVIEDAKQPLPKVAGDVAMGGGVVGGGVSGTVQTLQEQLTPFSMAGGWITKLVITLAIISALLAVGGFAWRWYATYRQRKIDDATDPDGVKLKEVRA